MKMDFFDCQKTKSFFENFRTHFRNILLMISMENACISNILLAASCSQAILSKIHWLGGDHQWDLYITLQLSAMKMQTLEKSLEVWSYGHQKGLSMSLSRDKTYRLQSRLFYVPNSKSWLYEPINSSEIRSFRSYQ